jgi:hypothetical protein
LNIPIPTAFLLILCKNSQLKNSISLKTCKKGLNKKSKFKWNYLVGILKSGRKNYI